MYFFCNKMKTVCNIENNNLDKKKNSHQITTIENTNYFSKLNKANENKRKCRDEKKDIYIN